MKFLAWNLSMYERVLFVDSDVCLETDPLRWMRERHADYFVGIPDSHPDFVRQVCSRHVTDSRPPDVVRQVRATPRSPSRPAERAWPACRSPRPLPRSVQRGYLGLATHLMYLQPSNVVFRLLADQVTRSGYTWRLLVAVTRGGHTWRSHGGHTWRSHGDHVTIEQVTCGGHMASNAACPPFGAGSHSLVRARDEHGARRTRDRLPAAQVCVTASCKTICNRHMRMHMVATVLETVFPGAQEVPAPAAPPPPLRRVPAAQRLSRRPRHSSALAARPARLLHVEMTH